jgi:threonine dehydratase
MQKYVDDIIKVSEESIAMSVLLFLERKKLVVEGAGAVPLAALIEQKERFRGKKIILVISGGNIDFTLIDRIIHKGLVSSGRIGVFKVIVDDVPVGKTLVTFTVETKGRVHFEEIISSIKKAGLSMR